MKTPAGSVQVRFAALTDLDRLCELLSLLFAQEEEFVPNAERQKRALEMILSQPEVGRIFCAVDEGAVIGMVSLLFTISTAEGGRAAWLEDMIIDPTRRGEGVGHRLLQTAIAFARTDGCRRITLLTDAGNNVAWEFYQGAGFAASPMVPLRLQL